jgi:hypothetical protein
MHPKFYPENLKGNDHLRNICKYEYHIKMDPPEVEYRSELASPGSEQGSSVDLSEQATNHYVFIKIAGNLTTSASTRFSRRSLLHGVSCSFEDSRLLHLGYSLLYKHI